MEEEMITEAPVRGELSRLSVIWPLITPDGGYDGDTCAGDMTGRMPAVSSDRK
jgi:hypothetical protein